MKRFNRTLMVMLFAVLTVGIANAEFRIGPRAGITVNKLHLDNVGSNFEADNRCGFTGGVMADFTVPIIGLGVDASLMYARMNSRVNGTGNSTSKDFFEVPINLKYKIGLPVVGNFVSPYVYTGPSFAFRLGKSRGEIKQKGFQWAWNVGIGVELLKHLQVGAGYAFGINNIIENTKLGEDVSSDIKLKNNYWTITAAYLF